MLRALRQLALQLQPLHLSSLTSASQVLVVISLLRWALTAFKQERKTLKAVTAMNNSDVVEPSDYYRVGYENRLPASEVERRQNIRTRVQAQFEFWQKKEQNSTNK